MLSRDDSRMYIVEGLLYYLNHMPVSASNCPKLVVVGKDEAGFCSVASTDGIRHHGTVSTD